MENPTVKNCIFEGRRSVEKEKNKGAKADGRRAAKGRAPPHGILRRGRGDEQPLYLASLPTVVRSSPPPAPVMRSCSSPSSATKYSFNLGVNTLGGPPEVNANCMKADPSNLPRGGRPQEAMTPPSENSKTPQQANPKKLKGRCLSI